jgi:hypothetical protein
MRRFSTHGFSCAVVVTSVWLDACETDDVCSLMKTERATRHRWLEWILLFALLLRC